MTVGEQPVHKPVEYEPGQLPAGRETDSIGDLAFAESCILHQALMLPRHSAHHLGAFPEAVAGSDFGNAHVVVVDGKDAEQQQPRPEQFLAGPNAFERTDPSSRWGRSFSGWA